MSNMSAYDEEVLTSMGNDVEEAHEALVESTSQLKAEVIRLCETTDVSSYRISKLTGVSQTTINRWRREVG